MHYGFGRHAIYVRPTLIEAAKYGLLAEMLGVIATFLIKVSVCLFVLRLIRGTHPKIRMILWGLIVIQFGVAFVTDVLYGTACRPFKKLWDREQPGVCLSPEVLVAPMRLMGGKSVIPCVQLILIWRRSFWSGARLCLRHHSHFYHRWTPVKPAK